jgi:hypothetical protein
MSSVVISGDTSGSVTLQAPAVAGTTVLSLPNGSGTVVTSTNISSYTTPARGGTDYATLSSGTPNITLTSSSNQLQVITSTAYGQSITLPDMTTLTKGSGYFFFFNTSIYPIAIKDTGGTIREYLPPFTGGPTSTTSSVPLNIEDNTTANGVWHLNTAIYSGNFDTNDGVSTSLTINASAGAVSIIQVNSTQFLFLYVAVKTAYVKLATVNTSTKAITFGVETTVYTWGSNNTLNNIIGESNLVDRGVFAIATYNGASTTQANGLFLVGFAIVSNVVYVSAATSAVTNTASTGMTLKALYYTKFSNWFVSFSQNTGGSAPATNIMYASAYQVNVAGTTVSLTGATSNNLNYGTSLITSPTGYTSWVAETSTQTTPKFINFDTGTTTLSSAARTGQTTTMTQYLGVVSDANNATWSLIVNNAGTKIINGQTYAVVSNVGTATVTAATTTINAKDFSAKSYTELANNPLNVAPLQSGTYYPASSSNWIGIDATNKFYMNIDPSNANFNINFGVFDTNGTFFVSDTSTIIIFNTNTVSTSTTVFSRVYCDVFTLPTPYIS